MEHFQSLFGIPKSSVGQNCLLLPFLPPRTLDIFGIRELQRGTVFSAANTENITIIKTGIGAGFVGDATLYLQDTACRNIFFLGTCGLINQEKGLAIGDLVLPQAAYGFESFSDILSRRVKPPAPVQPNDDLYKKFISTSTLKLHRCPIVSFASLHEEEKHLALFKKLKAEAIEMECAALFLAARKTGKKALALLLISDILKVTRFYEELSAENKRSLSRGAEQASTALKSFISSL